MSKILRLKINVTLPYCKMDLKFRENLSSFMKPHRVLKDMGTLQKDNYETNL